MHMPQTADIKKDWVIKFIAFNLSNSKNKIKKKYSIFKNSHPRPACAGPMVRHSRKSGDPGINTDCMQFEIMPGSRIASCASYPG
jgi:hypothetical protein